MSRLRARAEEYPGSSHLAFERNYLLVRPAIAVSMIVAVVISGSELPGRDGLIRASGVAIAYNFLIAYFIATRRMYLLRASSRLLDNATVTAASLFVFWRMGYANYESDLWLIYISLIVSNSLYYGPSDRSCLPRCGRASSSWSRSPSIPATRTSGSSCRRGSSSSS